MISKSYSEIQLKLKRFVTNSKDDHQDEDDILLATRLVDFLSIRRYISLACFKFHFN